MNSSRSVSFQAICQPLTDHHEIRTLPLKYADIYPSAPLLNSDAMERQSAAGLMSVRYFQAAPDRMPEEVFEEHHVLLNLQTEEHRVQNWRDGKLRDFIFRKDEVIVTPAGVRSGWQWHGPSDVIVITLDPAKVERFAQAELGMLLDPQQFKDLPQFSDADLCAAGVILRDALASDDMSSAVMFEAMSRVLLVKMLQKFGKRRAEDVELSARFTSKHYQRVLTYVQGHLDQTITVDQLAAEAGMSPSHFARVFKETLGSTPMQYVMAYRIEQGMKMMENEQRPLGDIALACGFSDQAHFTRSFKQVVGMTPRAYRASHSA